MTERGIRRIRRALKKPLKIQRRANHARLVRIMSVGIFERCFTDALFPSLLYKS